MEVMAIPHYLRFARALAMVSVALPAPTIAAHLLAGCTGGPGTPGTETQEPEPLPSSTTPATGTQPAPSQTVTPPPTGVQRAPGVQPAPGVSAIPTGSGGGGIQVCPSCDGGSADSGGPSRGTPELPASWTRA
jgi:hypothetical protein